MSVSEQIAADLPFLRRYARALTGSQEAGDRYVRSTLEAALADPALLAEIGRGKAHLFGVFTRLWSSAHVDVAEPDVARGSDTTVEVRTAQRLSRIAGPARQALLLTTMEGFPADAAAIVMGTNAAEIERLVDEALDQIAQESATDVLIIEDEPLIAMQLEQLVEDLGHHVIGTASTRDEARAIFADQRPGLVLADIQLADGSSGIDAVNDILAEVRLPVIFITAYPEKLLTGDRPEPTYLISKPFREDAVRIAISQAMFFDPA